MGRKVPWPLKNAGLSDVWNELCASNVVTKVPNQICHKYLSDVCGNKLIKDDESSGRLHDVVTHPEQVPRQIRQFDDDELRASFTLKMGKSDDIHETLKDVPLLEEFGLKGKKRDAEEENSNRSPDEKKKKSKRKDKKKKTKDKSEVHQHS
eukprot:m.109201 g.109201  ORF g.109201 m.109201 type:complete len:151 (-) comp13996_c0_seq2:4609-5061(-)